MVTLRGDPVYAVTKVYALKSMLLPAAGLEDLAYSKNLSDFVDRLRATTYGPFLAQLQKPYTAVEVEKALTRGLVNIHHKLVQTANRPNLLKALFTRYVYFNIKTILKSRALGLSQDEILKRIDLYPEELTGVRDTALRALTAKDLGEFLKEFLATPYHGIVQKAVEVWNNRRDFSAVDAVIDRDYIEQLYKAYRKSPRDERKLLQSAMVLEIDMRALAIAIRGRLWGLVPSVLKEFLPEETVEVPRQLLDALVESDDVKNVLSQLPEKPVFSRIQAEQDVAQVVSAIEETVKSYRVKWASQSFYKTPFKQLNLIAFIYLKEAEVRNLSTIAKYIEEGVSDVSVIKSSLLFV